MRVGGAVGVVPAHRPRTTATVGRRMSRAKPDFGEHDAVCWFEHGNAARARGTAPEFRIFDADGLSSTGPPSRASTSAR